MKYFLTGFIVQLMCLSTFAGTLTSRVHSIDKGGPNQADLIMLESGETAFIEVGSKSLTDLVEESLKNQDTLEIEVGENLSVLSIHTVEPEMGSEMPPVSDIQGAQNFSYDPSIITSNEASTAFINMRRNYQNKSQCYNRAHVWSYEEFKRSGLKSGKLFLFFTSKYIRNYRYHWWFHVTPMVYVGGLDQSNWRTLDRRYTAGPLTTRTWTDVFMLNNAHCPVVHKYTDYRNHQQSQDCYLIPTSMYFWQPRDIANEETSGNVKTEFIQSEVSHAYWEAF